MTPDPWTHPTVHYEHSFEFAPPWRLKPIDSDLVWSSSRGHWNSHVSDRWCNSRGCRVALIPFRAESIIRFFVYRARTRLIIAFVRLYRLHPMHGPRIGEACHPGPDTQLFVLVTNPTTVFQRADILSGYESFVVS